MIIIKTRNKTKDEKTKKIKTFKMILITINLLSLAFYIIYGQFLKQKSMFV